MIFRGRLFGLSTVRVIAISGAAVGLILTASSCGPAPHASQTIKRLQALDIANDPPPGAVLLGRASDKGDSSGITGRDASIETVFATDLSPAEVVAYYRQTYPSYDFGGSGLQFPSPLSQGLGGSQILPGPDSAHPVSRRGASITIQATIGRPYVIDHLDPKLAQPPTGYNTYVVVYIIDQPRDAGA